MAKYVDVLLHPSLYEGAPFAVMEAQALGVPVITYDLPWAQEFIINGVNGYRIPYPNTVKLAEGIVKAAGIKVNGIIQSAKKFDKKLTFKKLENVFNKVLYPDAEQ
jgi:glycosyltransferase involved in cell wall biosynthesis